MEGIFNYHPQFVSIIIPIRNEANYIQRSLEAVLHQEYPLDYMEVFVVDGMSNDDTRSIVQRYIETYPILKLIDNPGKIVPTGINTALRFVKGEIIIRVDGHCEIATDYVRRCMEHLQYDQVDGVGGPMNTIGETPLAATIAIAMSSKFGVGGSAFRTETKKTILADSVPFPAYTRQIVQKAGLYDEELVRNQDDEYNYRLRALGAKILLAADIHSTYYSRGSLSNLWKQYYQYGYWKVRVLQKHPRQMRLRQFAPLVFVLALLLSALFAFFPQTRPLSIIIPLTYLATNLFASLWIVMQQGWQHLPVLPLTFAVIHLSYGLGFLIGLVKFANRWGDKIGKVPTWNKEVLG